MSFCHGRALLHSGHAMKAAVLYGKENIRVEIVPARPLQPGEARICIEAALTCGTDLKVFKIGRAHV